MKLEIQSHTDLCNVMNSVLDYLAKPEDDIDRAMFLSARAVQKYASANTEPCHIESAVWSVQAAQRMLPAKPLHERDHTFIPGTVISGTLRPQDLLPAFDAELTRLGGSMDSTVIPAAALADDSHTYWLELYEDALNDYAPDGYYFGGHPDDGSDFGFWQVED